MDLFVQSATQSSPCNPIVGGMWRRNILVWISCHVPFAISPSWNATSKDTFQPVRVPPWQWPIPVKVCWKWFFMSIVSTKSVSSRRSKWTSPVNINRVHLCCLHQGLLGQVKLQKTYKGETFWPEPAAMPFLSPDLPEAIYSGPHDLLSKSHPISWPFELIRELCDKNLRRICERSCPVNKPTLFMPTLR